MKIKDLEASGIKEIGFYGSTHLMVELYPNPKKIINLATEVCSF